MARLGGRDRAKAASLLFVAAALHVVATFDSEHMEKQLFVMFFWAVVFAQSLAGFAILRGGVWIAAGIIALNVFLILAFVVTRFVPVPGEPMPEPIEVRGLVTKAVEGAALPFLARIARTASWPFLRQAPTEAL